MSFYVNNRTGFIDFNSNQHKNFIASQEEIVKTLHNSITPTIDSIEDLYHQLKLPKKISFDFCLKEFRNEKATWYNALHELSHFAVMPNWYLNFLGYNSKLFYKDYSFIPIRSFDFSLRCPSECFEIYLPKSQNGLDRFEVVFNDEWACRAWCLRILNLKNWINPITTKNCRGNHNQWKFVESNSFCWRYSYFSGHELTNGFEQLDNWFISCKNIESCRPNPLILFNDIRVMKRDGSGYEHKYGNELQSLIDLDDYFYELKN